MHNGQLFSLRRGHQMRQQTGIGLLEVLVAMVVVSFGVLGLAGLQLSGMKQTSGGFNRTKALLYADDMVARMRLNPAGVLAGNYDGFDTSTLSAAQCAAKPAPYCQAHLSAAGTVVDGAACSAAELAAFDQYTVACGNWSKSGAGDDGLLDELVAGSMVISCDSVPCTADDYYTLTVSWSENSGPSKDEDVFDTKRVQVRFNP